MALLLPPEQRPPRELTQGGLQRTVGGGAPLAGGEEGMAGYMLECSILSCFIIDPFNNH